MDVDDEGDYVRTRSGRKVMVCKVYFQVLNEVSRRGIFGRKNKYNKTYGFTCFRSREREKYIDMHILPSIYIYID